MTVTATLLPEATEKSAVPIVFAAKLALWPFLVLSLTLTLIVSLPLQSPENARPVELSLMAARVRAVTAMFLLRSATAQLALGAGPKPRTPAAVMALAPEPPAPCKDEMKVNSSLDFVALVPPTRVVTVTSTVPGDSAGDTAVIVEALDSWKLAAETEPN